MTFNDDEVRLEFHKLATALQVELAEAEKLLNEVGKMIHVMGVIKDDDGELKVIVRVD